MAEGTVIYISRDRRFGFVQSEAGAELLFYTRDLREGEASSLRLGEQLEFQVTGDTPDLHATQLARRRS